MTERGGCESRRYREASLGSPMPRPDKGLVEIGHSAKSPRPGERAWVQCLGEMPWDHRATAVKPDISFCDAPPKESQCDEPIGSARTWHQPPIPMRFY